MAEHKISITDHFVQLTTLINEIMNKVTSIDERLIDVEKSIDELTIYSKQSLNTLPSVHQKLFCILDLKHFFENNFEDNVNASLSEDCWIQSLRYIIILI